MSLSYIELHSNLSYVGVPHVFLLRNQFSRGQSRCETLQDEYLTFLAIPWYHLADLVSQDK